MFVCACHHLLALSSPNRWGCLCCLSDGTHHQLYENPLLLIHQTWQHRGTDRCRTEWVMVENTQCRDNKVATWGLRSWDCLWCIHSLILLLTSLLQQECRHRLPVSQLRSCHTPQTIHQVCSMLMELSREWINCVRLTLQLNVTAQLSSISVFLNYNDHTLFYPWHNAWVKSWNSN